jgi:alpha-glucuronidase
MLLSLPYSYFLTNGKTIADDMHDWLRSGVQGANEMLTLWKTLDGKTDPRYFETTKAHFKRYSRRRLTTGSGNAN